jgi:hypothetical protein
LCCSKTNLSDAIGRSLQDLAGQLKVAAIGEQFLKKWKFTEQRAQDENAAIAILNVRAMNDGVKQQA